MRIDRRDAIRGRVLGRVAGDGNLRHWNTAMGSVQALESLKDRLLEERLAEINDTELQQRIRRAANDSASLAWATAIPLLALPELLAEKAGEASRQFKRQQSIRAQGPNHFGQIELAA